MNLAKKCSYFTALLALVPLTFLYLEAGGADEASAGIVIANLVTLALCIYSAIVMGVESRREWARSVVEQRSRYKGSLTQERVRSRW